MFTSRLLCISASGAKASPLRSLNTHWEPCGVLRKNWPHSASDLSRFASYRSTAACAHPFYRLCKARVDWRQLSLCICRPDFPVVICADSRRRNFLLVPEGCQRRQVVFAKVAGSCAGCPVGTRPSSTVRFSTKLLVDPQCFVHSFAHWVSAPTCGDDVTRFGQSCSMCTSCGTAHSHPTY